MANYSATVVRATALLALGMVLAACGTKSNPNPKTLDPYVAMGDSYTALAGVGPFTDAGCVRSQVNYPTLVAKELKIATFTDASCGGATSDALTQEQTLPNGGGVRRPQMNALNAGTKLVTLGIGLNDYSTSSAMLYLCLRDATTQAACASYLQLPDSDVITRVRQIVNDVKGDLEQVRKAAPNARIVLVGYPRVLPDGSDCSEQIPLPAKAASRIRTVLQLLNAGYAETARKAKVDYVDMWSTTGHDVCSTEPWMAGEASVPGKALQFHPYAAYAQAVADKIVALLKK